MCWNGSPNCKLNVVIAVVCAYFVGLWLLMLFIYYFTPARHLRHSNARVYVFCVCLTYTLYRHSIRFLSYSSFFFRLQLASSYIASFHPSPPCSVYSLFIYFFFIYGLVATNASLCAPESNKMTAFSYNEN